MNKKSIKIPRGRKCYAASVRNALAPLDRLEASK